MFKYYNNHSHFLVQLIIHNNYYLKLSESHIDL